MVHLRLEPTEAEVLRMVLESYLSDLRMEIADTDSMDFREKLKARKQVLRKILESIALGKEKAANPAAIKPSPFLIWAGEIFQGRGDGL